MDFRELVTRSRSFRRFHESEAVSRDTLETLVDFARLSPSAQNRQPLKYLLSCSPAANDAIFPHLGWAGYLADWPGPEPGERPPAYIVICGDREISREITWDHGIAAQTILLGAASLGLGGCMIGSLKRDGLRAALGLPERYDIMLVIALGRPKETVIIEPVGESGDIRYWRDADRVHHVPKRSLADSIISSRELPGD